MRRVILLVLLAICLPTAALASSIDYAGFGSGSTASMTGSAAVNGSLTITLGQLSINGGAFTSGVGTAVIIAPTLGASCGAGCFDITGGSVNIWSGGVNLFHGTFTSGAVTVNSGITNVSGFLTGGSTVATIMNLGSAGFMGSSNTIVTPEPGTLGLLGTGLIGLAGIVRRKLRS